MTTKELKNKVLGLYKNDEERKLGDFYTDELREGLDEIINITDDEEIDLEELKSDLAEIEITELADGMVDPYTGNLLEWYSEDLHRCHYADEFMKELGSENDLIKILSGGQYMYYNELLNYTFDLLKDYLEKVIK